MSSDSVLSVQRVWVVALLLAGLCLVSYANSFSHGFMMDDKIVISGEHGALGRSLFEVFQPPKGNYYRPIPNLLLWFEARAFGSSPAGYHVVNLLFFWLLSLAVWKLVVRLERDRLTATLASALFATHPINGFLVNYKTGVMLTTAIGLMLASFYFFVRYFEKGSRRNILSSGAFFLLAILSHEMALFLPLTFLVYWLWGRGQWTLGGWHWLVILLLWPVMYVLGRDIFWPDPDMRGAGILWALEEPAAFFSTSFDLIVWYLSQLVWPDKLLFLWGERFEARDVAWKLVMTGGVLLGFWALFLRKKIDFQAIFFGAGILLNLFFCFVFCPNVWPFMEPHWMAFYSVGVFVIAARWAAIAWHRGLAARGAVVAVCAALVMMSWINNSFWRTEESYCRYWLSLNKGNSTPYYWLGRSALDRGDCEEAQRMAERSRQEIDCVLSGLEKDIQRVCQQR